MIQLRSQGAKNAKSKTQGLQENLRNIQIYRNNQLLIFEALTIFDGWLLIKARWFVRKFSKWVLPVMKVLLFMAVGAALVLTYFAAHPRFDSVMSISDLKLTSAKNSSPTQRYRLIDDKSKFETIAAQKERVKIKCEATRLEKSLRRMNLQLKNLYDRQINYEKNLADFASEKVGGMVVATPDTESYNKRSPMQISLFGVPIWRPNYYTPRKVIQPWIEPGECWAFRGSQGKIEIELAHSVVIEKVTLEHIPVRASITGTIDTAPKTFNVLGKMKDRYIMIDTFTYSENGLPSQTFKITKEEIKNVPFKRVILEVISNWGNTDYTCIYRFKVHGKIIYRSFGNEEENSNI